MNVRVFEYFIIRVGCFAVWKWNRGFLVIYFLLEVDDVNVSECIMWKQNGLSVLAPGSAHTARRKA